MSGMRWEYRSRMEKAAREPVERPVVAWWWTIGKYPRKCGHCGERIAAQSPIAYNHATRESVCEICCDALGHVPQPSKRFLAARKKG